MNIFREWWLAAFLFPSLLHGNTVGLIGGDVGAGSYAAFVSDSGAVSAVPTNGVQIFGVAINASGNGIVGGIQNINEAYAALISQAGVVTHLTSLPPPNSRILSVAINNTGHGLIGGSKDGFFNNAYAALISPSGDVTSLTPLPTAGPCYIQGVALNDAGNGLIGGTQGNQGYVARVSAPNTVSEVSLGLTPNAEIRSVALNSSGKGLVGGRQNGTDAYAAFITPDGQPQPITPLAIGGAQINSVALNSSGMGLVGGIDNTTSAYAALISPAGTPTEIMDLPSGGAGALLRSVALNDSGLGLIGGRNGAQQAYAAFVSPTGALTVIQSLPTSQSIIESVALDAFGNGIIGGSQNGLIDAYAALVTSGGALIPLNLPTGSHIFSVAIFISHIPTEGLSGNNLAFANYINENAPLNAFYFVPAVVDGTLAQALESAAPTRNAFALFTADNNLFYLDTLFSKHSRNARHTRRQIAGQVAQPVAVAEIEADQLLVANKPMRPATIKNRPFQLWGSVLGAVAYQKAQQQTPAFQPTTGGAILGFDGKVTPQTWLGAGAAYTYTHIHEKKGAGHSNINQEYLFLYSMWDNTRLYFDATLWGSLFQIDNVRKIKMTGFEFQSKSHPHGWQLSPHVELGYDFNSQNKRFTAEPFVMVDWISNWQRSYKEKGSGPFNAAQKHHDSSFLRSEIGARLYETICFDNWNLVFQEKASYVYKKPFQVGRVNAFLVGFPGSFTVETLTTPQNLGVAEVEILFQPKNPNCPYTSIQYQGEFGSMYQSHLVSLDLTWNF